MQVWEQCKQNLQRADISSIEIGAWLWGYPPLEGVQREDSGGGSLFTPITTQWLTWRYRDCPVKDYGLFKYEHKGNHVNLFFCLKGHGIKTELRICTAVFSSKFSLPLLTRASNLLAHKIGCRIVTCGGLGASVSVNQISNGWLPITRWSVVVTVRNIPNGRYLPDEDTNWLMQTGDMELF